MIPTNDPKIQAEIRRAAEANVKSGKWMAPTPLLDAIQRQLDGAVQASAQADSNT